jgi:hypothetical protein
MAGRSVAWLARLFRVQEVVSSNLTAPTIFAKALNNKGAKQQGMETQRLEDPPSGDGLPSFPRVLKPLRLRPQASRYVRNG